MILVQGAGSPLLGGPKLICEDQDRFGRSNRQAVNARCGAEKVKFLQFLAEKLG